MKNPHAKVSLILNTIAASACFYSIAMFVHIQNHEQNNSEFISRNKNKKRKEKIKWNLFTICCLLCCCLFSLKITHTTLYCNIDRRIISISLCMQYKVLRVLFFVTLWINYVNHGNENYNVYYVTHITRLQYKSQAHITTNDFIRPFYVQCVCVCVSSIHQMI